MCHCKIKRTKGNASSQNVHSADATQQAEPATAESPTLLPPALPEPASVAGAALVSSPPRSVKTAADPGCSSEPQALPVGNVVKARGSDGNDATMVASHVQSDEWGGSPYAQHFPLDIPELSSSSSHAAPRRIASATAVTLNDSPGRGDGGGSSRSLEFGRVPSLPRPFFCASRRRRRG